MSVALCGVSAHAGAGLRPHILPFPWTHSDGYAEGVAHRCVRYAPSLPMLLHGEGHDRGARGHSFSASSISAINKTLDEAPTAFAERRLEESYPYLILDARYEKIREGRVIRSQAVWIAIGIHEGGRHEVLATELASRERHTRWKEFLLKLKGGA